MLPGIRGSLVANAFLEDVLLHQFQSMSSDEQPFYRQLVRWWRRVERSLGPASGPRAVLDVGALPLVDLLGYEVLHVEPHGTGFVGTVGVGSTPLAVLRTTGFGDAPEPAWRDIARVGRTTGARWGLIYTGHTLRVIDAARTWSRRGIDFDFRLVAAHRSSATVLFRLAHRDALESRAGCRSLLDDVVQRSNAHALAVCDSLGDGVLDALDALLTAFNGPARSGPKPQVAFDRSLTLVYRLLFLLFAEARDLVPIWNHVYRDAFTVDALWRSIAAGQPPRGLWKAFTAMSRLAHAGCRAGDLSVTAFNGRLFSPAHNPDVERVRVPDAAMSRAVLALATSHGPQGRRRISYADLGVEQLGTVYERVLDYEPTRSTGGPGPIVLTRTSHERKRTGSFYTPRAMTEFLVRRTLHPLVTGRDPDEILALKVVDPAMGSGAFLVAACRYLASAIERSLVARSEWPSDGSDRDRRAALRRRVAERCLYGVDRNPMAVQLARLSLWLTTLASDRPLTFLDHHLAAGDSLIGAGFIELARNPADRRRRTRASNRLTLPLFFDQTADELARTVLPERFRLASEPGDDVTAVREKERALDALNVDGTALSRWRQAAHLWCAAWFPATELTSAVFSDVLSFLVEGRASLVAKDRGRVLRNAATVAREQHFFHWELEFPEVFFDSAGRPHVDGGFDAVIGNPPWDTMRADTGDADDRSKERASQFARLRFFRDSGVFRHQGSGHLNRYQLFVERALQLTRLGGRIGLVLPSGLATDRGSGPLRRALLDRTTIDRLLGFSNRDAIFPIHRDLRFFLLTTTKAGRTDRLEGSYGATQPSWLEDLPDSALDDPNDTRGVTLLRASLDKWDPEQISIPWLPTKADLDLLVHVNGSVPALSEPDGWNVRFGRELNATEDRRHFVSSCGADNADLIPVIEGKHLEPFRVRADAARLAIPAAALEKLLNRDRTFGRVRIAYRDVASATNRLSLIAAVLPPGTVSTHTVFCLRNALGARTQYCLLALLNSLVANYLVRLQVTTHVSSSLMRRLRVPRPHRLDPSFQELAHLAGTLAQSGVEADEDSYVRINTIAAALYGLTAAQYEHVVETFNLLSKTLRKRLIADYSERGAETRKR